MDGGGYKKKRMNYNMVTSDYRIEPIKKDILKLIDKVEDLEQMIYNCDAKRRDEYKLINDRINELLERIIVIEKGMRE